MTRNPPRPHPNAAPPEFIAELHARADALGVAWPDALRRAEIGRQSAWRLARGTASLATARRVEAVLDEIARVRGPGRDERMSAWIEAGRDLLVRDRVRFDALLAAARR